MKYLLGLLMVLSLNVVAQDAPAYLKDATITVTLKNGKTHTYSANDYAVVKRGKIPPKTEKVADTPKKPEEKVTKHKHIISGELVRSNRSLDVTNSGNEVDIRNKKEFGLGIQYQYNLVDDLYVGGRVDANGGMGLNIGVGF
jgi:hypothetical protein